MNEKVLVDTSSWIEALRKQGREEVRLRVERLLTEARAILCDMVMLELWTGARGKREKAVLSQIQSEVEMVETDKQVWNLAFAITRKCRAEGITVPATDILVVSCARRHKLGVEHCDRHFPAILDLSAL